MVFFEEMLVLHFSKVLLKIFIYCVKEAASLKTRGSFQSLLEHHHPQLQVLARNVFDSAHLESRLC